MSTGLSTAEAGETSAFNLC